MPKILTFCAGTAASSNAGVGVVGCEWQSLDKEAFAVSGAATNPSACDSVIF